MVTVVHCLLLKGPEWFNGLVSQLFFFVSQCTCKIFHVLMHHCVWQQPRRLRSHMYHRWIANRLANQFYVVSVQQKLIFSYKTLAQFYNQYHNNQKPHCIMIAPLAPITIIWTTLSTYLSIISAKKNHTLFCQFSRYTHLFILRCC